MRRSLVAILKLHCMFILIDHKKIDIDRLLKSKAMRSTTCLYSCAAVDKSSTHTALLVRGFATVQRDNVTYKHSTLQTWCHVLHFIFFTLRIRTVVQESIAFALKVSHYFAKTRTAYGKLSTYK